VALAELAGRQWGVVSLAPLQALGVGRSGVTRRVQGGRLRRVHRGVYAVGGAVLPREGRWLAAVLACGPAAVLSHVSAAVHWNLLTDQAIAGDPRFTRGEPEALMNKLARDYGLPQHECNTSVLAHDGTSCVSSWGRHTTLRQHAPAKSLAPALRRPHVPSLGEPFATTRAARRPAPGGADPSATRATPR
jgi:hypothetical protein